MRLIIIQMLVRVLLDTAAKIPRAAAVPVVSGAPLVFVIARRPCS